MVSATYLQMSKDFKKWIAGWLIDILASYVATCKKFSGLKLDKFIILLGSEI